MSEVEEDKMAIETIDNFVNHILLETPGNYEWLHKLPDSSIDLLCTDPPYGISFMGKEWDKALPSIDVWKECFRVLKPGAFSFVMSIPRSDCYARMVGRLIKAGFELNFTPIFWAYATGFPKAHNISKAVDKRCGVNIENKSEFMDWSKKYDTTKQSERVKKCMECGKPLFSPNPCKCSWRIHKSKTERAKELDGSYGGFQPKPAVEVIIVAMKPLSEKTYVDQALKNRKGITQLEDCRIPYRSDNDKPKDTVALGWAAQDKKNAEAGYRPKQYTTEDFDWKCNQKGRFPANLLVSDDVLNDGTTDDSGSFSRYFSLDTWWEEAVKKLPEFVQQTFPFLIVPKASKSERNKGCSEPISNYHPTVKPLKLMSYLVALGSREGDIVLDPFVGSGTTAISSKVLKRKYIGIDAYKEYVEIAEARLKAWETSNV